MKVKTILNVGRLAIRNHSNEILTGVAILGTIGATYCALKEGPKCKRVLEELEANGATNAQKAGAVFKTLAPSLLCAGVSVGASLLNCKLTANTIRNLIDTCAIASTVNDLRVEKTKEIAGEEKAAEIEKAVYSSPTFGKTSEKAVQTGHGNDLFYYADNGSWFYSCVEFLTNVGVECKDRIINGDEVLLVNEFNQEIGLRSVMGSTNRGWHPDRFDGYRRETFLTFEPAMDENNHVYTIMKFTCPPSDVGNPNKRRW